MNSRLLITGAGGVVGSSLATFFASDNSGCVLVDRDFSNEPENAAPSVVRCDLESPAAVHRLVEQTEPEVVIHLAGNKDVFALESDPELARRANLDTTKNLVQALAGAKAFVIYLSTDYVFEGTKGPYGEASPTEPSTVYGRSKLAAERCLLDSGLAVAIARTASLFGFPRDFVSLVTATLAAGRPFSAFSDLVSNPTAVEELAEMLRILVDRRLEGVFHVCGVEAVSRLQFAREIAAMFCLDDRLITPQLRSEDVRPADLSLLNRATCAALNYEPRPLRATLERLRDKRAR